jgi:zinc/manganese transport system substrate-binding protein
MSAGRPGVAMSAARRISLVAVLALLACTPAVLAACGAGAQGRSGALSVVASTSWLADIAQNVAGDRFTVASMIPLDTDPHSYEPTPSDLTRVAKADLLLLNGGGLEGPLEEALRNAGADTTVVVASEGLTPRRPQPGEPGPDHTGESDPHYWLDPVSVKTYVENIRDAFSAADPQGAAAYEANATAYLKKLDELDRWVREQVKAVSPADRKLIMNHASYGYFADRYGFRIVGAVLSSVTSGSTPTARQLADLVATIKAEHVKAIFVEAEEDPRLAEQIAAETGVTVIDDLLDHSLTGADGPAPTYVDMIRFDTLRIVEALKK